MLWTHSSTRYLTDRNNHTCLFHSNSLCYKNNSLFMSLIFKKRVKMIEKCHAVTSLYRNERCENCVNSLEKCPNR